MTFADFHCDTISRIVAKNENLLSNSGRVDIKRLAHYESPVQVFALCFDGEGTFSMTYDAIGFFYEELRKNKDFINFAKDYNDILKNKDSNLISAMLAIEGGEVLEGSLKNIDKLYELGVRVFTLTWNLQNSLGYGALVENRGLTRFGKSVVHRLNELGIIVDVSHLSEKGFWDAVLCSERPLVASHSNCSYICPNPRNLSDSQIRVIAEKSSVIGVNFYPVFLNSTGEADLSDIVAHIRHIVNIGGIDTVALGSDFDGVRYLPRGVDDVLFYDKLYNTLASYYSLSDIEKIMSGNLLRIVSEIC